MTPTPRPMTKERREEIDETLAMCSTRISFYGSRLTATTDQRRRNKVRALDRTMASLRLDKFAKAWLRDCLREIDRRGELLERTKEVVSEIARCHRCESCKSSAEELLRLLQTDQVRRG